MKLFSSVVLGILVGTACAAPTEQEQDTTLPLFTGMAFDGAAQENPSSVLLFHVDFRDSDGNLGAGTLEPLINGKPTGDAPVPIKDLLLANNLPLDATTGTLEFVLEVNIPEDPASRPETGSTFDVGVLAKDGAGHESNRPTVTLEISF